MQDTEEAGKSLGIYQSNPQSQIGPVLDVEDLSNTRTLWEKFASYILSPGTSDSPDLGYPAQPAPLSTVSP